MKNLIKVIALSTILTSACIVAQEQSVTTSNTEMKHSMKNKSVDKKTELSTSAEQVIKSIENYPNTDLKVEVVGSNVTVSGTVDNEKDKMVVLKALESLQEFKNINSNITLSE